MRNFDLIAERKHVIFQLRELAKATKTTIHDDDLFVGGRRRSGTDVDSRRGRPKDASDEASCTDVERNDQKLQ